MRRLLLNAAAAISVVLCCACAIAWARSYFRSDDLAYNPRSGVGWGMATRPGVLLLRRETLTGRTSFIYSDDYLGAGRRWYVSPSPGASPFTEEGSPPWMQRLGFDHLSRTTTRGYGYGTRTFRRVVLPFWFLTLMTALLPVRRIHMMLGDNRRKRPGHCATCGYDLRASPERCPECGVAVACASAPNSPIRDRAPLSRTRVE